MEQSLFLSHAMYAAFAVALAARRKEGRAHSWPGFKDGPSHAAALAALLTSHACSHALGRRVPVEAERGL